MQLISAKTSPRLMMLLPVIVLVAASVLFFVLPHASKAPPPPFFLPLIPAVIIFIVMRKLYGNVAEEVWEDGDALVIKYRGQTLHVPLAEIVNIGFSTMTNPPKAVLLLRNPTRLGREIAFIPKRPAFTLSLTPRNAVIDQLIERVDECRRRR